MGTLAGNSSFWVIYFLIAFAMGYWNYLRGHNLMIGFFISVLFTPVAGLLFNILAKPNNQVLRAREKAKPTQCPSCGELMPAKMTKCRKCGERIPKPRKD